MAVFSQKPFFHVFSFLLLQTTLYCCKRHGGKQAYHLSVFLPESMFYYTFLLLCQKNDYFCSGSLLYCTMNVAETIKERRAALAISQLDLAEIAGVSIATVKDIERGKGNPSLATLEKIADVLGMEITMTIRRIVP